MAYFTAHNLLQASMRELCLSNINKIKIPIKGEPPRLKGALLVPLLVTNNNVSLLFTLRYPNVKCNNEICFPGGQSTRGETPEQTALRITEEDIGLRTDKIEIWGCGPEFPGRNNQILITPVIAQVNEMSSDDLKISDEVKEVFAVALYCFCDRENQLHTQYRNGYILPAFSVERYKMWGLTAYITHAFLQSLLPREVYHNDWIKKKVTLDRRTFADE